MSEPINVTGYIPVIPLGIKGEKKATSVTFDFSDWAEKYGEGTLALLIQRHGDSVIYPAPLEILDTLAVWTASATDTAIKGLGKATLQYTAGDVIKKGRIFHFFVEDSLAASGPAPAPYSDYVAQVTEAAAEAQESAQAAAESAREAAHYKPYLNEDGYLVIS